VLVFVWVWGCVCGLGVARWGVGVGVDFVGLIGDRWWVGFVHCDG